MSWKRVLGLVVGLASVVGGMCHGYLAIPAARNVQRNSDYCPHCLNGPEMCGDPAGQHRHETGGKYATPPRIAATYARGGRVAARVVITANHVGRWSLSLCARPKESPKCFRRLRLANRRGPFVYLPSSASRSSGVFRLPRNVTCKRCVLRWRWETANSCNPPGLPRAYSNPGLQTCFSPGAPPPEIFTNCADISIR